MKISHKNLPLFMVIFSFIFLLFIPINASANRTVRIAFYPVNNFYEIDATNTPCGYGIDYLNEIASYTGWSYKYIHYDNWESAVAGIKKNEADLLAPTITIKGQDTWAVYSNSSILSSSNAIMCLKKNRNYIYEDFKQLNNFTIGCSTKLTAKDELLNYLSSVNLTPKIKYFSTELEARKALYNGTVDAFVCNIMNADETLKPLAKFTPIKLYYLTSKKNSTLMNELNEALNNIQTTSPYFQEELYNKYFIPTAVPPLTKNELDYLKKLPVIRIACAADYFPLSFINEKTKELEGVIPDILHTIEKSCNLSFELIPISCVDTSNKKKLLEKKVDAVCPIELSNYFIQDPHYLLSKPFLSFQKLLIRKSNLEYLPDSHLKLGAVVSTTDGIERIQCNYHPKTLTQYQSNQDVLNAVKDGKEDIALLNEYAAQSFLNGPRYEELSIIPASGIPYQLSLSFLAFDSKEGIDKETISDPRLLSAINKTIALLSEDMINESLITHSANRAYTTTFRDILATYKSSFQFCFCLLVFIIIIIAYTIITQHRTSILLKEALIKANEGNRAKTEFLSRISHDIRTPMNAIIGMNSLAQIKLASSTEDVAKYLNQIELSSHYLLSILNDVLDMSSIENGKMVLNQSIFYLNDLLKNISIIIENQALTANLEYEQKTLNLKHNIFIGDSIRLNQIFINLLNNAVKYTTAGGKISFSVSELEKLDNPQNETTLQFEIKDTGIGMSEEFMQKMYEPFEQDKTDVARTQAGNGLGLSIVYSLIHLMNGTLEVKSKLNQGTTFIIIIPFSIPDIDKSSPDYTKKEHNKFHHEKILLVEDNEINLEIAKALLELYNLNVETASNGKEAVEKLSTSEKGYYSVILMDIRMPVMDGLEACSKIRNLSHPDSQSIPIIAMTANAFDEDRNAAINAGMDDFLTKPLDTKLLSSLLESYLSSSK